MCIASRAALTLEVAINCEHYKNANQEKRKLQWEFFPSITLVNASRWQPELARDVNAALSKTPDVIIHVSFMLRNLFDTLHYITRSKSLTKNCLIFCLRGQKIFIFLLVKLFFRRLEGGWKKRLGAIPLNSFYYVMQGVLGIDAMHIRFFPAYLKKNFA